MSLLARNGLKGTLDMDISVVKDDIYFAWTLLPPFWEVRWPHG